MNVRTILILAGLALVSLLVGAGGAAYLTRDLSSGTARTEMASDRRGPVKTPDALSEVARVPTRMVPEEAEALPTVRIREATSQTTVDPPHDAEPPAAVAPDLPRPEPATAVAGSREERSGRPIAGSERPSQSSTPAAAQMEPASRPLTVRPSADRRPLPGGWTGSAPAETLHAGSLVVSNATDRRRLGRVVAMRLWELGIPADYVNNRRERLLHSVVLYPEEQRASGRRLARQLGIRSHPDPSAHFVTLVVGADYRRVFELPTW